MLLLFTDIYSTSTYLVVHASFAVASTRFEHDVNVQEAGRQPNDHWPLTMSELNWIGDRHTSSRLTIHVVANTTVMG